MKLPVDYTKLTGKERRLVREEYIKEQGHMCFYCGKDLGTSPPKGITDKRIDWDLFPPGFLDYPVHLQHNHDTGMTEGAVHAYCNAVMWQYHGR
jgi:hypothetical protein